MLFLIVWNLNNQMLNYSSKMMSSRRVDVIQRWWRSVFCCISSGYDPLGRVGDVPHLVADSIRPEWTWRCPLPTVDHDLVIWWRLACGVLSHVWIQINNFCHRIIYIIIIHSKCMTVCCAVFCMYVSVLMNIYRCMYVWMYAHILMFLCKRD